LKTELKRIFVPKRKKLHNGENNKELHNLYSPNIIGIIKPRKMRWLWHEMRMGEIIS
jgi:hypothetical protein